MHLTRSTSYKQTIALIAVTTLGLLVPSTGTPAGKDTKQQKEDEEKDIVGPGALEALRSAQTIAIRSNTTFFQPSTLEQELFRRKEFIEAGIQMTKDATHADLIVEVSRKRFTTKFPYLVLDGHKGTILLSGIINSIGGTVEGKIADRLSKQLDAARHSAPPEGQADGTNAT